MSGATEIFWTGGWDSTFRVMELLTTTVGPIQPRYVIDPRRASSALELATIRQLTQHLEAGGYAEPGRIREPVLYRREEIPPDPDIDEAFLTITRQNRLGNQYRWLAMLVKAEGLDGIELSVEKGRSLYPIVGPFLVPVGQDTVPAFRVAPDAGAVAVLLGGFVLPLIQRSDARLRQEAAERGWDEVLAKTCFCHSPVRGRHPCGTCRPCVQMLERKEEGARLGWIGKTRYWAIERAVRTLPVGLQWRCRQWQETRATRKVRGQ